MEYAHFGIQALGRLVGAVPQEEVFENLPVTKDKILDMKDIQGLVARLNGR